jgi:hypothetical protein
MIVPTYIEMLKLADRATVQGDFLTYLRGGGLLLTLSAILLVIAVLWFFVAVGSWQRRRLLQTIFIAVVGAGLGWVGSYVGYQKAVAIVEASEVTPKPTELAEGANHMAFAALGPSGAAVGVIALCILGMLFVRSKKQHSPEE